MTSARLSCSSSPKKVTLRLGCSLVNALSSSRTAHRLRLRSSPLCSLRRSSSPKKVTPRLCCSLVNALATRRLATNFFRYQEVRCCAFPPVGNAHRAFRGGKRAHVPCGRSTGKHDIVEKIHNKLFQSMQCPSVDSSSRTAHRLRLRSSPLCSLRRSSSRQKVSLGSAVHL